MDIVATTAHGAHDQGLWQMQVDVQNMASVALAPHFTISTGQSITPFWHATGGPAVLAPHQRATYDLTAAVPAGYKPGAERLLLPSSPDRPADDREQQRIPIQ